MLEDKITGPIYKVVRQKKGHNYSVSRINLFVSGFVIGIWVILFIHKIYQLCTTLNIFDNCFSILINSVVIIATIVYVILIIFGGLGNQKASKEGHNFVLRVSEIQLPKAQ